MAPANAKTIIFDHMFVSGSWDQSQRLLQALKFIFLSNLHDFVKLLNLRLFWGGWKAANTFLMIWEPIFLDLETREELFKGVERVWKGLVTWKGFFFCFWIWKL